MKSAAKKTRRIRRLAGRVFRLLIIAGAVAAIAYWLRPYYPAIGGYLAGFGRSRIDTETIDEYYGALTRYGRPSGKMVLGLGVRTEGDIQAAIDRLKGVMGLGKYKIWFAHHDADKPPAYIKQLGYGDMGILVSRSVKEPREVLNLLVHELGHVYVWDLNGSVFGKYDQEKLNDCAGVYLGLGVIMLNGFTDEFSMIPGGGYEARRREFGYLRPEQVGYLVARYCDDHGIPPDAVRPFLGGPGRRYFDTGVDHVKAVAKDASAAPRKVAGMYWCPGCASITGVDLSGDNKGFRCASCGKGL